jgi:cytochrome c-type biogenesis protein CcmH/NrfG
MLGDLYVLRNSYGQAAAAYETAIELDPANPIALNNYAWLLATASDPDYRNHERALELALRAAAIEQSPHVMDTLAESYFVNGRIPEAIESGRIALDLASTNQDYYRKQLEKFKAGVETPAGD